MVLASIVGFSGVVIWLGDLLEGNISAINTPIYEDIKEVSSFIVSVLLIGCSILAFKWGVTTGCRSFSKA
jgi:hypothetical protein